MRTAVQRGILLSVAFVDLGPSTNEGVRRLKEKHGFPDTLDWKAPGRCDYTGAYRTPPDIADVEPHLVAVSRTPGIRQPSLADVRDVVG